MPLEKWGKWPEKKNLSLLTINFTNILSMTGKFFLIPVQQTGLDSECVFYLNLCTCHMNAYFSALNSAAKSAEKIMPP